MNDLLPNLIEALREELKQYGEMLALLEHQHDLVVQRQTDDLLRSVTTINAQTGIIAAARHEREQRQRQIARALGLAEESGFDGILQRLPVNYRPLAQALVQENNELLIRVQQRARQNHLLLNHCVELMQHFINSIFPASKPVTYDGHGLAPAAVGNTPSLYQAMG